MFKKNKNLIFITPLLISLTLGGCFSHNIGEKFNDPIFGYLKAFVSNGIYMGNMTWGGNFNAGCTGNGIATANCICNAEAANYGIHNGREFRAWISTSTIDARCNILGQSANNEECNLDFYDPDGYGPWLEVGTYKIIINSFSDFVDGNINETINYEASESVATVNPDVWTGTYTDGIGDGNNCINWTNNAGGTGTTGSINRTDSGWSHWNSLSICSASYRLYCFEQPDL